VGASMLRNELAIALFVWSIDYIRDRRLIPFVAITFLAMQFHSSAIVLFAFYLFAYIKNIESKRMVYAFIFIVYVTLLSTTSQLGFIIEDIAMLADEEEALEFYSMDASNVYVGSGVGTIISYSIFVYIVFTTFRYSSNTRLLFYMLLIGTFVRPFAMILPAIGRYAYYFSIFQMVCYPIIWGGPKEHSALGNRLSSIFEKRRIVDLIMLSLIIFMTLYEYFKFFIDPTWIDKFSEYHTIFEI
ncbi:MAG: EpsG family protein, partial [Alistipes sp.]|nr:EpsG family protein [Alistipes sp.]